MADCFLRDGETVELLLRWGKWARTGGAIGRVRCSLGALVKSVPWDSDEVSESDTLPDISDDEALEVDAVVAQLRVRDRQMFKMLEKYFVFQLSMREISRSLNLSRRDADKLLAASVAWVDCGRSAKLSLAS